MEGENMEDRGSHKIMFAPSKIVVSGPSGSGKSTFIQLLVKHIDIMEPVPTHIFYVSHPHSLAPNFARNVIFSNDLEEVVSSAPPFSLIIVEDLFIDLSNSKTLLDLYTRDSRHKFLSVCFSVQNIFAQESKILRTLNRNTDFLVLFANFRDSTIIRNIAIQISPQNWRKIVAFFNTTTQSKPYSYVIFNFTPYAHSRTRILTNIFGEDDHSIATSFDVTQPD